MCFQFSFVSLRQNSVIFQYSAIYSYAQSNLSSSVLASGNNNMFSAPVTCESVAFYRDYVELEDLLFHFGRSQTLRSVPLIMRLSRWKTRL